MFSFLFLTVPLSNLIRQVSGLLSSTVISLYIVASWLHTDLLDD